MPFGSITDLFYAMGDEMKAVPDGTETDVVTSEVLREDDSLQISLPAEFFTRHEIPISSFSTDECLLRIRDPADCLYVVQTGNVSIERSRPGMPIDQIAMLGPGHVIGEMGLLRMEKRRTATARAVEPTTAWKISASQFHHLCRTDDSFAAFIGRLLSIRMRQNAAQARREERESLMKMESNDDD